MLASPETLRKKVALLRRVGIIGPRRTDFRVRRAITSEDLRAAYALVHQAFVEKGYIEPVPGGVRVRPFEALPEMATFIAESSNGEVVGVMSIVPDTADLGLPSDGGFRDELELLRSERRAISEITNLAIAPPWRNSPVLLELSRAVFAYAFWRGYHDMFVAISPGHARFFEDVLQAVPWGGRRDYCAGKNDIVEGKRWNLSTAESVCLEADLALGEMAFLHDYFFGSNPYHKHMAVWDKLARKVFRRPRLLRALFVEASGWLMQCPPDVLEAIRLRWGETLFEEVQLGESRCPQTLARAVA